MEIKKYITENESKMLEDLFSLIRIPSISAKPEYHDDMLACAERWAQLLLEAGADEALVMPSKGNPIVFGQKIVDPDAKTVLVYAHYDVMPAEPLELWKSEPFEPENQRALVPFLHEVRVLYPHKTIWCYTGNVYETELLQPSHARCEVTDEMLSLIDVLVDGEFIPAQHDISLRFRGSGNQRIIDLNATRAAGHTVLWQDDPLFADHKM